MTLHGNDQFRQNDQFHQNSLCSSDEGDKPEQMYIDFWGGVTGRH